MSSSEEQESMLSPNPFTTARRSKKYTSKKSYKEYLKTRQQNQLNQANLSSTTNDSPVEISFNDTHPPLTSLTESNERDKENMIIAGKENSKQNAKFSLIMNDIHGIKLKKLNYDDTHSIKINRMHGISNNRQQPVGGQSQQTLQNGNNYYEHHYNNLNKESKENLITITNVNEDKVVYNNLTTPINLIVNSNGQQATENGTGQSPSSQTNDYVNKSVIDLDASRKKYTEGMEVKRRIAIATDDWYVSASDVDDSDTMMGKSHCNTTTVNPVLECVNQVNLQLFN